jgi:hypothetical protein
MSSNAPSLSPQSAGDLAASALSSSMVPRIRCLRRLRQVSKESVFGGVKVV